MCGLEHIERLTKHSLGAATAPSCTDGDATDIGALLTSLLRECVQTYRCRPSIGEEMCNMAATHH